MKRYGTPHLWLNEALQWSSIFSHKLILLFRAIQNCRAAREAGRWLFAHLQPGDLWLHQPGVQVAVTWGGGAVGPALSPWSPQSSEDARAALHPRHTAGCRQDHAQAGFCKKLQGLGRARAGGVQPGPGQHPLCNKTSSCKKYCPPQQAVIN